MKTKDKKKTKKEKIEIEWIQDTREKLAKIAFTDRR